MLSKVYFALLLWLSMAVETTSSPSPSPTPSPTSELPTCAPRVTLSQMCDSLTNLKTQTLSREGTTGDCTISDNCLNLQCTLIVNFLSTDLPISFNMTLLPCASPYSFGLEVVSTGLGGELVNGVYSDTTNVPVPSISGDVSITVVQQTYGVTLSVGVVVFGQTLTLIDGADIHMHCVGVCALPNSPSLSPSPSPSPTSEPPTCLPRVTLSQMCDSLNNLKTQTLSLEGTTGDCTVSDDCLNLQCAFTVNYNGITVPLTQNMTLLPCTSPYSFGLVVSSSFLGSLVNGVYSESGQVPFTVLGVSGNVVITVVQQEFGVTVSVAADVLGSLLTVISQTDVYMHCADNCQTASLTVQTSTAISSPPSLSPSPSFSPFSPSPSPSLSSSTLSSSPSPSLSSSTLSSSPSPSLSSSTLSSSPSPSLSSSTLSSSPSPSLSSSTLSSSPSPSLSSSTLSFSHSSSTLSPSPSPPPPPPSSPLSSLHLFSTVSPSSSPSSSSLPSPSLSPSPSPSPSSSPSSPSPTSEPPTCPQIVTLSQMCDSLNNLKTQTLSLEGTTGDCTISDDCLNLQCAFTVTYNGITVPLTQNMTLLPCTSPYSFKLVVSSSFLGDLVNGVYSESGQVPFTALGVSGNVIITVVQQEFGVNVSVAADVLGSLLTVISQTDVYMHCASICASSSPTVQTATALPSPSLSPSTSSPAPSPSPSTSSSSPSPSPMLTPSSTSVPALPTEVSLEMYMYIANGLLVAVAGVTAILVIFLWLLDCKHGIIHQLGKLRHVIHVSFALSLVGAALSFVLGHEFARDTENLTVCRVVSGLLFYFALSTAFWLVCDVGALAYMATKAVLRLPLVSYILIFIVGWGLPVLPVVITALVNTDELITWNDNNTDINFCWIDANQLTAYGFIAPLVACTLVGFVYMGLVVRGLTCVGRAGHVQLNGDSSDNEELTKANIVFNVICQLLLSIALAGMWLFGLFFMSQYEKETTRTSLGVLFLLFAVLQCVLFVLLAVVGHPKVWHFLCCCRGNPNEVHSSERNAQLWETESPAQISSKEMTANNYLKDASQANSKDIELTQTQSQTFPSNGVTAGDDTSIKDIDVEITTKEGNAIFSDEVTPRSCPQAAIGGSSQSSVNLVGSSPAVGSSNSTLPASLPPPSQQEDTTQV